MVASELVKSKMWLEGPDFLQAQEDTWPEKLPKATPENAEMLEKRLQNLTHLTDQTKEITSCVDRLDLNRYSSYSRLIHVTGWVCRFVTNCRSVQESRERNVLTSDELTNAENFWVRQAEAEAFPQGEKEKALLQLNPQADNNGIIRVNGRLKYADDLPFDARHPILLPRHHPLTELIIKSEHQKLGHGTGVEHLLCELRTRYWIPKGRKAIHSTLESCPGCRRRFTAKPVQQIMAPLPKARVTPSLRAFEQIGVHFGGPYLTKQGRGKCRAKRYICLFTCLTTRAVHLEMAYGLETDSFINAFVRMTARRGTPRYVVSDNGTNFVGAERELRQLVDDFNRDRIVKETNKQYRIEWKFNPPAAPHFGGVFEAMIKAAKRALRSILGNADVTDEELHTAICGAESLLNSRPITYVSADVNDLTPLTPNPFLCQLRGRFAPEALNDTAINPRKRWHRIQQLLSQFWKRWRREFLPTLNSRKR